MPNATNDASTANVVEADAFIVRDPRGRKRVLIGNLWPAKSGELHPGVALYDELGSERVCLLLGDAGPVVSFAQAGDTRLEIGLRDERCQAFIWADQPVAQPHPASPPAEQSAKCER